MMSTDKSNDYLYETVLTDLKIRRIFDHYRKELFNQHRKIGDEIFNWRDLLMYQIRETVTEQLRLLDQEYENQKNYLKEKREEYVAKALNYEKNNNNEQIGQLLTQCNALKFELAALEYSMRPISYLTSDLKHGQLQSIPIERIENDIGIGIHTTESSPPEEIPPRYNKKKSRRSIVKKCSDDTNGSVVYPDNPVEECPMCNMVFSLNMKPTDRTKHVDSHFSDNIEY